jgi:hypothetical protein
MAAVAVNIVVRPQFAIPRLGLAAVFSAAVLVVHWIVLADASPYYVAVILLWKLGQACLDRGSKAFAGEEHIPFAVNNEGNLR